MEKEKSEEQVLEAVPANIIEAVRQRFVEIKTLLKPYVVALTPEQRRKMLKMGDKSDVFVDKAYRFAVENPAFVPAFLNMTNFNLNLTDARNLRTIHNDALQVYEEIDDTILSTGSVAFEAALTFYNFVKLAAERDVPDAKAIYEELKKRFSGHKHKNGDGEE
ncbi:MAG: hypothetical protein LBE71_04225 [Dysgonamonadaceae bacterium]|jgi:hypothetical protein|nr:hypothetical protein [Dysgonamonadaceae bacterium]